MAAPLARLAARHWFLFTANLPPYIASFPRGRAMTGQAGAAHGRAGQGRAGPRGRAGPCPRPCPHRPTATLTTARITANSPPPFLPSFLHVVLSRILIQFRVYTPRAATCSPSAKRKKKKTSTRMFDTLGQEKMLLGIPRVFFVCVFFVAERVGHGVD